MFSYLDDSGSLALRLSEGERGEFLKRYKTTLFRAYGAITKEDVTIPEKLLRNTEELQKYFDMSYEYVKSLKPKPSKKKS